MKLGGITDYDDVYPYAIKTRPYITLARSQWVEVNGLVANLSLTKSLSDWRQVFRSSIKKLDDEDGEFLEKTLQKALKRSDR